MTAEQCPDCGTWLLRGVVGVTVPLESCPPVSVGELTAHTPERCRAYRAANGEGSR